MWRNCHLRIFIITQDLTADSANAAAEILSNTLRQRRLFDVGVELILADDEMTEPCTYAWTSRFEDKHTFLHELHTGEDADAMWRKERIPLEIAGLFSKSEAAA